MKNVFTKALTFLAFFVLAMVMFLQTAFAYIDPSAATYLITAIAAVAVSIGTAVGFYFRRLKRAVSKKKHKDEEEEEEDDEDEDEDDE